jgi:hypothetical protein
MPRRWTVLLSVVAGLACSGADQPSQAERQACQQQTGGTLRTTAIAVHTKATLRANGHVSGGRIPGCSDSAEAWQIYRQAHAARSLTPEGLRPASVTVLLDPRLPQTAEPVRGVELHQASSTVLVQAGTASQLVPSVWLHEFAHLRARGPRPTSLLARRIYAALDEGVADYYAAAITGRPALGGQHGALQGRHLEHPPPHSAYGWASVAIPVLRFDPHEMGWQLAARFWRAEPAAGELLADLVAGLASHAPLPTAEAGLWQVLQSFWQRCPARSRARIRAELSAWVPAELRRGADAHEDEDDGDST